VGNADLLGSFEWIDAGSGRLLAVDRYVRDEHGLPVPAVFRGIGRLDPIQSNIAPDAGWTGDVDVQGPFRLAKAKVVLERPKAMPFSIAWDDQLLGLRNLMRDERVSAHALPADNLPLLSSLIKDDHFLATHDIFTGGSTDLLAGVEQAYEQETWNMAAGDEFATDNMPFGCEKAREVGYNLMQEHTIAFRPLPAYDTFIPPRCDDEYCQLADTPTWCTMCGSVHVPQDGRPVNEHLLNNDTVVFAPVAPADIPNVLPGSLVDVRFTIQRQYVPCRNAISFIAEVQTMFVLEHDRDDAPKVGIARQNRLQLFTSA